MSEKHCQHCWDSPVLCTSLHQYVTATPQIPFPRSNSQLKCGNQSPSAKINQISTVYFTYYHKKKCWRGQLLRGQIRSLHWETRLPWRRTYVWRLPSLRGKQGRELQFLSESSAPCFHMGFSPSMNTILPEAPENFTGSFPGSAAAYIIGCEAIFRNELPRVTQKEEQHLGPNKAWLVAW